jgi:glycosyltransferase involved in cell wall biosynthesis
MKKILYIHHAVGWGGAPNSLIKMINGIDRTKYDVDVLLLKYSNVVDKLIENNISFKIADSIFYRKYYHYFTHSEAGYVKWYQIYRFIKLGFLWSLSRFYFAKKELAKHNFQIVHLNSSVLTDWLAPAKTKGKVIIHIREPFRKGKLDLLHFFFTFQMRKYADRIIAISKDNATRVGIPEKTEVIYNFEEIPQNNPLESSYSSKKVFYLGGSEYIKGFYTLVDALDYLDKDVKVYFGGNIDSKKKSRFSIKFFLKFLLFYGKKKKEAIEKIKHHHNAFVIDLTYNVHNYLDEVCCLVSPFSVPHFSRPVIEAYLHKKPAIGTDVKGMDEIIEHEKNGLIVPKNNPVKLAAAINDLTADGLKAKRFGEAGYEIAILRYSPENIHQIEQLYDRLLL